MSNKRLLVGDAVRLYIDDINNENRQNAKQAIGFIRFIGFIPDLETHKFTQSIGVELLEQINNGHNGTINNTQYFTVENGFGIHVPITNIIQILSTETLMFELKNSLNIIKEKQDYIHDLEAIINNKKQYLPDRTPALLTNINVDLPSSLPPSHRNTYILPAPITPISEPNTPITERNSLSSFPLVKPKLSMQNMIIPQYIRNNINTLNTVENRSNYGNESPSISLTQSETFSSYTSSLSLMSDQTNSIPSTPITPFTPTPEHSPFVIYEKEQQEMQYNNVKIYKHTKVKSFSRRLSLLHKKPIPEIRNNDNSKKKKKN